MLKYSEHDSERLDLMFHALADPARRVMVLRLSRGPASVSELAEPLDMTLSAVVQHLAVLESSGLVRSAKKGRVRTCELEPKAMMAAEDWLSKAREEWEARLDRLDAYLKKLQSKDKGKGKKA